jgi:hypothetical protein
MFPRVGKQLAALVALTVLTLASGAVQAQISFRNDLKTPVIVQGASVVRGMLRRGPPLLILPGKTASDRLLPLGPRVYTIYDANQPNSILFRDQIRYGGVPLQFVIQLGPGGNVQVVPAGKAKTEASD